MSDDLDANHLVSLWLMFLVCKRELITHPALQNLREGSVGQCLAQGPEHLWYNPYSSHMPVLDYLPPRPPKELIKKSFHLK